MLELIGPSRLLFTLALALALAACGDDGTVPPGDGGPTIDGASVDCSMAPDGTACGSGQVCIGGSCVAGECGDGYVDTAAGEDCDDGNDVAGDGCEPGGCVFSCGDGTDCDDLDPCNGEETCNPTLHRCQAGAPADGAPCTIEGGGDGVCSSGTCAPPGCGNSVVEGTEECDDGMNGDNTDGCRDDCAFTCDAETPCADADLCDGDETCDSASHTCEEGPLRDCDDDEPCTADSCDPIDGCVNQLIDVDGDMYAPGACTTGLMGGDCNDTSFSIYPGATELCDSIDNDCDMMIDDGTVDIDCYRDADGDTYGDDMDVVTACTCPTGYITRGGDCEDNLATVNPMHGTYESAYYCIGGAATCVVSRRSWDWNCSGYNEQRYTSIYSMCAYGPPGCSLCVCQGGGWVTSVPACGTSASYRPCGAGLGCSAGTPYSLVQTCR